MGDSNPCNHGLNEVSSTIHKRSGSSVAIKTTLAEVDSVLVPTMAVGSKNTDAHPIFTIQFSSWKSTAY